MRRLFLTLTLFITAVQAVPAIEPTDDGTWFTGVIEPAKSVDLSFGHFGRIISMRPVGYITNRYFAKHGGKEWDIMVKGDVVAMQDTTLYENSVRMAESDVRAAQADLTEAESHLKRCQRLADKHAISKKALGQAEAEFQTRKEKLANAQGSLASAKYQLERCYLRAPFSGQIEETYCSVGAWAGPGQKVLRITLVSLVEISVRVPERLLRNIGITDSVLVYPPGSDEPVGVWFDTLVYPSGANEPVGKTFENISPDRDQLRVYVANQLVPIKPLTNRQRKLPRINKIVFVSQLNASSEEAPLWVPFCSLRQDQNGGYYVWRAKGQRMAQPGKPIAREFQVEKVPVVPAEHFRDFGVYKYRQLKDAGGLKPLQLVLPETEEEIKDGDTVVIEELQWLFSTGDQVSVRIPDAEKLMGDD